MNNMNIIAAAAAASLFLSCAGVPAAKAPEAAPAQSPAAISPEKSPSVPEKKPPRVVVTRIPLEIKSTVLFADGVVNGYTQSERDASGQLMSQTRFTASGTPQERIDFVYKGGKLDTKETKDAEGKLVSRRSYVYGPSGALVAETLDDGSGKRLSSFSYSYDADGKRISWIVKDAMDAPIAGTVYAYKDGKIQKAELRDGLGRKTGSSAYEYEGDHLTKQSFFDAGGSLLRTETSSWTNGKVILEERKSAGGAVLQRTAYEYGADGELLRKTLEDVAGKSKLTTTYEYAFKEERKTIQD